MDRELKTLKDYLWGTPDRLYTFISIIIGLISIGLTLLLWKSPQPIPTFIIIRDCLVVVLLFLITAILIIKYVKRESSLVKEIEELNKRVDDLFNILSKEFEHFHMINHKLRNDIFSSYKDYIDTDLILDAQKKQIFDKICHSITSEVKKIFLDFFEARGIELKDNLAVTIKLTLPSREVIRLLEDKIKKHQKKKLRQQKELIITAYRDPETYEEFRDKREICQTIYSIPRNTAFIHIFQERRNIFCCDDLEALGDTYLNENGDWKTYYNSTIVAPIRFKSKNDNHFRYFGLLAVDCLNRNKENLFENDESKHIVGHAVDTLANLFLMLIIGRNINSDEVQNEEK